MLLVFLAAAFCGLSPLDFSSLAPFAFACRACQRLFASFTFALLDEQPRAFPWVDVPVRRNLCDSERSAAV